MRYLAVLIGAENEYEVPGTPEFDAAIAGYDEFDRFAGDAVAWGAALHPVKQGFAVRGGVITDGPFTEAAEVTGGLYVLTAEDLDAATELARRIPAASDGAIELWPLAEWQLQDPSYTENWVALLREPARDTPTPGTPDWADGAKAHSEFGAAYGSVIRGGGALHPASAATTVRVRGGQLLLTDGPYAEAAEVVNGLYLFECDEDTAREVALHLPVGAEGGVEMRPIVSM
ncbi:YciI family protein [Hoyosella sp. YIM 151337]|uniref:YciI family protein n=1 Tax=Hoyosella sp. YIM 151337 TaxID=2992742 RepID=UPI0022367DF4|nr:YciI family protein [Hoyosella sp. YIM 151337]MCW4353841.1 YciI family protein [Hoyosella sp. YIM 151337]